MLFAKLTGPSLDLLNREVGKARFRVGRLAAVGDPATGDFCLLGRRDRGALAPTASQHMRTASLATIEV